MLFHMITCFQYKHKAREELKVLVGLSVHSSPAAVEDVSHTLAQLHLPLSTSLMSWVGWR